MADVSHKGWRRHGRGEVAVDELLDAAGLVFAELGVARATMVDVARAAGCSRATLYRYFPNRAALHLAFVHRATLRIAARMPPHDPDEGRTHVEHLVDRILAGIAGVRADPLLAVWFEPENMAVPMALSQDSEVLRSMAAAFIGELGEADDPGGPDGAGLTEAEVEARGGWLLRTIVSLLAMPGADEAAERSMVETFVVPVLQGPPATERSNA